jgi:uncharacterized protein (DUF58 family)
MVVVVVILLLLAAAFGVLGAVLKAAALIVLTAILAAVVLGAIAWWALKRKVRSFQADIDRQLTEQRVTRYRVNEAQRDPRSVGPARDDRY